MAHMVLQRFGESLTDLLSFSKTPATTNLQKVTQQQGVAGSAARDASQEPQRAEVGKSSSKPR